MTNKEPIEKIKKIIRRGDMAKIADLAEYSIPHVRRFFSDKQNELSAIAIKKIRNAVTSIIKERKAMEKNFEKKIDSLLD